jgi:hypothetical protein
MELHRFTMQLKSELEARQNGVLDNGEADARSPASPTSKLFLQSAAFSRLASTQKKELESEV